jgi:hypothetical protein
MRSTDEDRRPWVARSAAIIAIVWVAGYFLTGTVAGATIIAGMLVLVALAGLLYT